jgi:hypothetical protein
VSMPAIMTFLWFRSIGSRGTETQVQG